MWLFSLNSLDTQGLLSVSLKGRGHQAPGSPRTTEASECLRWQIKRFLYSLSNLLQQNLGSLDKSPNGDCSHEIKRRLLLGRKVMTNLDSVLKSRDITLSTKVSLVKAMVFPVVMYGCESWTIKKAEHWRIDAFELWCWRRLLRVPWTTRRSNHSILKEISPWKDWCWSWNSNTLATWCEELTHLKRLWCWKRLKAGGEGDDRGWDGWMAPPTQWTWIWVDSGSWWWTEAWRAAVHGVAKSWTRLSDWTELNWRRMNTPN